MTTQKSPLRFTLSDGRQVSVDHAKSVLQISDRGIQRRCMVVRGSHGAAIYNAGGDVQINGAPSSSHWLELGDRLEFSPTLTATVDQLGELDEAITQLQSPVVASELASPAAPPASPEVDNASRPGSVLSALANAQQAQPSTPVEAFRPATDAASEYLAQVEASRPVADSASLEAQQFIPATDATIASPTASAIATPQIHETTTPPEVESTSFVTNSSPEIAQAGTETLSPTFDAPPMTDPSPIGLAANLLKQIQEDNEAPGIPTPTPTHSQVAGGASFSPEIREAQPQPVAPLQQPQEAPLPEPQNETVAAPAEFAAASPVEQVLSPEPEIAEQPEPSPAANQPTESVAALLERMKSEGQWGGVPEEDEPVAPIQETPEPQPEMPVAAAGDCEDDVQSYMSQLLSRMRGGDAAETVTTETELTTDDLPTVEQVVALEKAIQKLRPEEFVPKTKAKRVEGWQGMRELANSQVRNAIDKSQERKRKKSICAVQLATGVASGALAVYFWVSSIFGGLSAPIAVACAICGGYAFFKSYVNVNVLAESKPKVVTTRPTQLQVPANAPPQQPQS